MSSYELNISNNLTSEKKTNFESKINLFLYLTRPSREEQVDVK